MSIRSDFKAGLKDGKQISATMNPTLRTVASFGLIALLLAFLIGVGILFANL